MGMELIIRIDWTLLGFMDEMFMFNVRTVLFMVMRSDEEELAQLPLTTASAPTRSTTPRGACGTWQLTTTQELQEQPQQERRRGERGEREDDLREKAKGELKDGDVELTHSSCIWLALVIHLLE